MCVFYAIHRCCGHRQTADIERLCFVFSMLLLHLGTALNPNTTANRELPSAVLDLLRVSYWIILLGSDVVVSIVSIATCDLRFRPSRDLSTRGILRFPDEFGPPRPGGSVSMNTLQDGLLVGPAMVVFVILYATMNQY